MAVMAQPIRLASSGTRPSIGINLIYLGKKVKSSSSSINRYVSTYHVPVKEWFIQIVSGHAMKSGF